ncbi:hypothetical protein BLOT_012457 [Blomia tropicalis]|nr:hypothetical protein BLOT_012457 [Blomia tropicalis]
MEEQGRFGGRMEWNNTNEIQHKLKRIRIVAYLRGLSSKYLVKRRTPQNLVSSKANTKRVKTGTSAMRGFLPES